MSQGLTYLLDNHLSHPLMVTLLPHLRDMFHDKADRVRMSFVALLDKVKGIKTLKVRPRSLLMGTRLDMWLCNSVIQIDIRLVCTT